MGNLLTRRRLLAGFFSTTGTAVLAGAPLTADRPRPRVVPEIPEAPKVQPKKLVSQSELIVQRAKLGGDVGFAVIDAGTGQVLDARMGGKMLPPASTLKVVTALYALEHLGADHVFKTRLLATTPVTDGVIEGDIVLEGGGDPTLDTDRLAELAVNLREAGVREVKGRLLVWAGALPEADRIDQDQPDVVSYNPAFGGLNLNFNRIHFEWKKQGDSYGVTMHARALRFSPATNAAHMAIVDRKSPVYEYRTSNGRDRWSVARRVLGKEGARWLPIRFPAYYAGDVFRTLARSNGIILGPPEVVKARPVAQPVVEVESAPLVPLLQDMLKYSTNLTAEVAGMSASVATGREVNSLSASAARMAGWAMREFGLKGVGFRDHSGLGYASTITPVDMAKLLAANTQIAPLLKTVKLNTKSVAAPKGVLVRAKTGTLNFVSSLAGFVNTRDGRTLCFAILTADTERRDAIPAAMRERPSGAKSWSRRSRTLQKELIRHWATRIA